jgi:uncharacterized membrane protein YfcA
VQFVSPVELVSAGAAVGLAVGLTGMGGGALMAPVLIQLLGVDPLTAVASDLLTALATKPVGAWVHWRRGTVHSGLARTLCLTSVPAAFVSAACVELTGVGASPVLKLLIGAALLLACGAMVAKAALEWRSRRSGAASGRTGEAGPEVRRIPTLAIGVLGGVVVGATSVGAGSLMMVLLMALYPALRGAVLVGTDLLQAIPLVAAGALAHALFGEVHLTLTLWLILGAVPATWLGAQLSSRASFRWLRPLLFAVLFVSGLELLRIPAVWGLSAAAGGLLLFLGLRLLLRRSDVRWRLPKTADGGQGLE